MDDTLETPRPRTKNDQEDDDHSSGDEDGGLDWAKLPKFGTAARPVIPKRGEKDFEPAPGGGSGLQVHVLDRARNAMFDTLRTDRTISSKTISYGIWYPSIDRVHVTTARGIHFSSMGHFAPRTVQSNSIDDRSLDPSPKSSKRLELLPEEALYLIERGALFCYKSISSGSSLADVSNYDTQSPGAPMSVQQAFAELIGREGLTLERYQVYAYLKRLGFGLIRAEPPTPEYPVAPSVSLPVARPHTPMRMLTRLLSRLVSGVIRVLRLFYKINWWRRVQLRQQKTTQDVFKALRFIPCGHTVPLHRPPVKSESSSKFVQSPYKVFFHVYKPSTSFRKTAPPSPDFYVVVVDARSTNIPTLQEVTDLFDILPEMPLPPPRKRGISTPTKKSGDALRPITSKMAPQEGSPPRTTPPQSRLSWPFVLLQTVFQRPVSYLPFFRAAPLPQDGNLVFTPPKPKPKPFLALKTGKKTIVMAAVDTGNISFFRFGQGSFDEWPMN